MTKQEFAERMGQAQAWVPGKRVKFDYGNDGALMLDGVAGTVSEENGQADTTIGVSWDNWWKIAKGELDPMSAFMAGQLRIEGDIANAVQLQSVLSKLRS